MGGIRETENEFQVKCIAGVGVRYQLDQGTARRWGRREIILNKVIEKKIRRDCESVS